MIVRVAGEGQWRVEDDLSHRLNAIDNEIVTAVEAKDAETFRRLLGQLCDLVATEGSPVPDDELATSDIVVPPRDTSLEEAHDLFHGDGLIPG